MAVAVATVVLTGLIQISAQADAPVGDGSTRTPAASAVPPPQVPAAERPEVLGKDWKKSGDVAWTTTGDAQGFHLLTAREKDGYAWETTASLSEPGFDADSWIGNACLTASGKRAVVVYAPRTFTNNPKLMARGGFTAVVELATGSVTKLGLTTSLSYYNPGCGAGETAVLTQSMGEDKTSTRLTTLDTVTGKLSAPVLTKGQVTSAVAGSGGGIVAAFGSQLVSVGAKGAKKVLTRTSGTPYRIMPDAKGGVVFLDRQARKTKKTEANTFVKHLSGTAGPGKADVIGRAKLSKAGLTRAGRQVYITGEVAPVRTLPSGVTRLAKSSKDAVVSTRAEAVVEHTTWADGKGSPSFLHPRAATDVRSVSITTTVRDTGKEARFTVKPLKAKSKQWAEGLKPSLRLRSGGSEKRVAKTAGEPSSAGRLAAAASSPTEIVESERTCSVPRNDPRNQAMQPKPRQVEWAVDQAIVGGLNKHISRAANWKNLGMPAYQPQTLFPNPVLEGGGRVPAQILLGITTQESNMWQAARVAVPGVTANPLIGNYYGIDLYDGDSANDWDVDFAEADCGYGITQVTDHMRMAGREDGHGGAAWDYQKQRAVALDYTANIAGGLQILVEKWNQAKRAGVEVHDGDPKRLENWFFALWAYNSGFYENVNGNEPWGVGWANNPANPEWDAGRTPFMEDSRGNEDASTAARPQHWPYPEKVLGFAAHPPSFLESPGNLVPAFRAAWWNGTEGDSTVKGSAKQNRAQLKPPEDLFCGPYNECDPAKISDSASNASETTGPCTRADSKCWWHQSVQWKTDCSYSCGNEFHRFNDTYPEEADGTAYPPNCTTSGLPSNALIVDDVPQGTPVVRPGCTNSWTNSGTFSFDFSNNGTESTYPSKVDLHQLGAGFGGHFYFGHTRMADEKGMRLKAEGIWKLNQELKSQAKVMVHLPDHGAHTKYATYEIKTGSGSKYVKISQPGSSNRWVSLGAFRFNNVPEVRLNTITSDGTGDEDIAFDAVAFVPGDWDGFEGVGFPDPVPGAPDPEIADTPETLPAFFSAVGALSNLRTANGGSKCQDVSGKEYDQVCFTFGKSAKAAKAGTSGKAAASSSAAAAVTPGENAACAFTGPPQITRDRFEACILDEFTIGVIKDGVTLGKAYLEYRHQIDLSVNAKTITQTVSLTPTKVDPYMASKKYGVNIQFYCGPDCGSALPNWTGTPAWISAADQHKATATATTEWSLSTGASTNHLHWTFSGTIDGAPTMGFDLDAPKSLDIRCDNEFSGKLPGCVFPEFTPSFAVNTQEHPAAAALYWTLMQKLPSHPGSKQHKKPLHRLKSKTAQKDNRDAMCRLAIAKFVKHPDTDTASCDEYPFAASRESGGQMPGITSGAQCAQFYAVDEPTTGWNLYIDDREGVPTWTEVCGRGNIPLSQNTEEGGALGRWSPKVRLADNDAYYVEVPGFEGCDPNTFCQVRLP